MFALLARIVRGWLPDFSEPDQQAMTHFVGLENLLSPLIPPVDSR